MNEHIRHITDRGVEALNIKVSKDIDLAGLKTILAGVDLKKVEVNLELLPRPRRRDSRAGWWS